MIRFAQISDLHLRVDQPRNAERARAALDWLDDLEVELACIVVSGDITHDGTKEQWSLANQVLASRHPIHRLRGNHDVNVDRDRRYPEAHDLGGLRLLVLDSNLPGQVEGAASDQLTWLEHHLATPGPCVVALHHPPVRLHHMIDDMALTDSGEFASVIARHPNVVAVLHGHAHTPAFTTLAGVPVVSSPGISSTFGLPFEDERKNHSTPAMVALHSYDGHNFATHIRVVPGT